MKKRILTTLVLGSTFLAGAGVGHAARDWRQLQDSKKDLYHAREHLNQAKADSFYQNLRPEHQAHLNTAIQHVNQAIGELDRIEWRERHGHEGHGHM
jgi:hypothetical protein